MSIDWVHFSPFSSFSGGLLIGLSAGCLVLFVGRVAGISGILGNLLRPQSGESVWRIAFLGGLVSAPMLYRLVTVLPESRIDAGWPVLVVAGLMVGVGTRYGAGCTSGHGVCGLSRLSPRSLAAVMVFMGVGLSTVFVTRHVLGF